MPVFFIITLGADFLVFVLLLLTLVKTISHAVEEGLLSSPFLSPTLWVLAFFMVAIVCAFLNLCSTWAQARDRNPAATMKIVAGLLAALVVGYFVLLEVQLSAIACIVAYQGLNIIQDRLYRRRVHFLGLK